MFVPFLDRVLSVDEKNGNAFLGQSTTPQPSIFLNEIFTCKFPVYHLIMMSSVNCYNFLERGQIITIYCRGYFLQIICATVLSKKMSTCCKMTQ